MGNKYKPVKLLPFDLQSIKDFIVNSHPVYFPESLEYEEYWMQQAEYVIDGKWGLDKNNETGVGGYRWCPGNLYFYINMCIIKDEGDDGEEITISPKLRDVEWYIFYALAACDGFSGFSLDDEYTCHRIVEKIEKGEKLSNKEEFILKSKSKNIYNSEGKLKKYKEAREYLYEWRDKPMGKALYDNEALNLILLSTRGIGKSFSMGNGIICYDFVTNGARNLKQFIDGSTSNTIVVGSERTAKSGELLRKFSDSYEHLRTNVGAYNKDGIKKNGAFWRAYEGSLAANASNPFTNKVKIKGGKGDDGPGSQIVHVSYKSNPQAGVGYRARRMIIEEAGLLERFFDTHAENSATQKRKTKFGYTVYIGTGGNIEKIKEIREAFQNPRDFQVLAFKDIFNGTDKEIGLFIPSYYRNDIFRDSNGNIDYIKAFEDEMLEREEAKKNGSSAYEGHIISFPIAPQEMFLNNAGNIYPTDALEERLFELESGAWKASIGKLEYTDSSNKNCFWIEDTEGLIKIIKRWGDEKRMRDISGGIVIYEHPINNKPDPSWTKPLYIVIYDPIHKEGENVGSSLANVFVFKFWDLGNPDKIQFNIVAEWVGRYPNMEDNHEQALKLATYYNAKVLPERNGDFIRYCRMSNRFYMLQPEPGLAIDGFVKRRNANDVGVYIAPGMISDLETYSLELLNKVVNKKEYIEGNLYIEKFIRVVHNLPSMRLTEELLFYDREGNFDYVSSLFLLGLFVRQLDIEPRKHNEENKLKTKGESIKKYYRASEYLKNNVGNPAFNY